MTFTISHVPTLRDVAGQCYVIAFQECVDQLVDALAVERLHPEVLRADCTAGEAAHARSTRCLLAHYVAWRRAARHDGCTLVCESGFVPCLGMGSFPAFWPVEDPRAWGSLFQECPRLLALVGSRPYLRSRGTPLVGYVITATVARILCDFFDDRMARSDPTGQFPFDADLEWWLTDRGCSAYIPHRQYGEHGGLPNPEHGASERPRSGRHRADNLAARLHFLPQYSEGSWLTYMAVRAKARLLGFARLATNRWIVDTVAYRNDPLTRLRMLGIGFGRLVGCSRDD